MVYKKYIKRDGKLYGPYIYERKRIDGKVVSQYHGAKRTVNLKKFAWIFGVAIFVIFLAYFISTVDFKGLTGKAILNTNIDYTEEQPIKGEVSISLKQGELIPASSRLILENSGQSYEYSLDRLVKNPSHSGIFYIEGVSLSGKGQGYGLAGEKQINPEVSFTLEIYPTSGEISQTITEATNQTVSENVNDSSVSEQVNSIANPETTHLEATPIETTKTTSTESTATETITTETTPAESGTSPITGFFLRIYSFFLTLTPTGNVVSDVQPNEINGQASYGKPFIYDLFGGEGVQLKLGSVSAAGSVISDSDVHVNVNGNQVIVDTSYSTINKGFGESYIGEGTEVLNINLSSLGLVLNEGDLAIRIVYENNEIISLKTFITPGLAKSVSENITN